MSAHSKLNGASIHPLTGLSYANAAARLAATPTVDDINKMAIQLDTGQYYMLKSISPTSWSLPVGGGSGQGGINYISNPSAVDDASGWNLYADAAGSVPVDGTGGSAIGVSITRNTTNPLRGSSMFTFGKDAFSEQGKGVSTDFIIDREDQGKPLVVSFDYSLSTPNFVVGPSSDMRVYLYDITNAKLIKPSPVTLNFGPNGNQHYVGTFDTAPDSLAYRLILHVATTNSAGYNLNFDNVQVGPMPQLFVGSPEISARYSTGSSQSIPNATATIINYDVVSYDKSNGAVTTGASWKFTAQEAGRYKVYAHDRVTSESADANFFIYLYKNGSLVSVLAQFTHTGATTVSTGIYGSDTIDLIAGDYIDARFYQDSGSSLTLNADGQQNFICIEKIPTAMPLTSTTPKLSVSRPASQSLNNSEVTITGWDPANIDNQGAFDSSTGIWTCQTTGDYAIDFVGLWDAGAGGQAQLFPKKNATYVFPNSYVTSPRVGGFFSTLNYSQIIHFDAGDIFKFNTAVSSSGSLVAAVFSLALIPSVSVQTSAPRSEVLVLSGNGYGSSSTKIRRFSTLSLNLGSDITYTDSASLGGSFAINSPGIYAISRSDVDSAGAKNFGLSLNTTNPTTAIESLSPPEFIALTLNPSANTSAYLTTVLNLKAGDVIRAHDDTALNGTQSQYSNMRITKVSN